jgi:NAD(P)-dependent dehydrogenase (short-subunit alcohol dehydrogenase family)
MSGELDLAGRIALVTGASGGIGSAICRRLAGNAAGIASAYGSNFISSVAAFRGGVIGPDYASSKVGLHGLAHFLASRVATSMGDVSALSGVA